VKVEINHVDTASIAAFVAGHPQANLGHDPRWMGVMVDGLGHRPWALSAWCEGKVVGWLPLAETSSVLFGRHLVSLPYLNEGGVLADDPVVAAELIDRAAGIARRRGARFLELRHRAPHPAQGLDPTRTDKMRMTLALPAGANALWTSLASKVRNQVRKGQSQELHSIFGGVELLDSFYGVFAVNMRDLGTPVFPRSLFESILTSFGGQAELCLMRHGTTDVAGALLVHQGRITEVPSASCLRAWQGRCANMAMYWRLLERAMERGSTLFDFGRSSEGSGTWQFKRQWGATAEPTGWQLLPLRAGVAPMTKEDQAFGLATQVWRRLPVWLTRLIGPPIVRGIP
jgi:FemAB-related protein (PEP-CTERM system-associated)